MDKKNALSLLPYLLALTFLVHTQTLVENPEKPLNSNAGRVLQLKEVMRITDGSGDFFFKEPRKLDVSKDELIFLQDGKDKLFMFDARGRFNRDLLRKGQGPGEFMELENFMFYEDKIILYDSMANKIVRLDMQGNMLEELKLKDKRFSTLLSCSGDHYYMVDLKKMDFRNESGIKDIGRFLYVVDRKGAIESTPFNFSVKRYQRIWKRGISTGPVTWLHFIAKNHRFLYISHTGDYLVKLMDMEHTKLLVSFKRKYKQVKREKANFPKEWQALTPDYHNDIQKLLIFRDHLWILTSTINEEKGVLTDVFNQEGKYIDCFYLPLLESKPRPVIEPRPVGYPPMTIAGDYFYACLWDKDWSIFIVKYEIVE